MAISLKAHTALPPVPIHGVGNLGRRLDLLRNQSIT